MNSVLNAIRETVHIAAHDNDAQCNIRQIFNADDISIYRFELGSDENFVPSPVELYWKIPAINVKGLWKPTSDFSKRIEADWELDNHESRISIDSPVISLFGNNDENIICFSCSNAINKVELGAKYREEDDHIYCKIVLFTECRYTIRNFSVDVRIDYRNIHFSQALKDTATWWEGFENLKPAYVPEIAKKPLYSTWYQFHQDLHEEKLLRECKIAKDLGFDSIIIDDGWQTEDNNRGYDYTGDWQSERFEDFGAMVRQIQNIGMKVGIWYSVPFCGKKSVAYQKFKGKFLTENHRWAPVFDPRFPEVREYLANIYAKAAQDWNLDGFKLDFIDDFKAYPDTSFEQNTERDFMSINDAVDALLTDVSDKLKAINPEVFIEFRQKYTGPAMRKYGNMLRAFDCPGDPTMNRVRIADLKMLSGNTAVHADMVTWHETERVEYAAFHYINTLFGVPQLSVMLHQLPVSHNNMIRFYTNYWKANSTILLAGDFVPFSPLANYPVKKVVSDNKLIIGLFDNHYLDLDAPYKTIDVINGKPSEKIIVSTDLSLGQYKAQVFDCQGQLVNTLVITLNQNSVTIKAPIAGMVCLEQQM
ncbi:glycoside hydrolase family 36 protein [uncultured Croceitalea sp.]|uniref:glycoside hydrolase family 36 protein n=1 Tax=uncultured Croceitalea sp. TaxID=1798908 RepID=UPI00330569C9